MKESIHKLSDAFVDQVKLMELAATVSYMLTFTEHRTYLLKAAIEGNVPALSMLLTLLPRCNFFIPSVEFHQLIQRLVNLPDVPPVIAE